MRLTLLLHNIRSTHNVGSLIRTVDCLGGDGVICSGYTPYPTINDDKRLPHISRRMDKAIHKTSIGAETAVNVSHQEDPNEVITKYHKQGYLIVGIEQTEGSKPLDEFQTDKDCLLILGEEVAGIDPELIKQCDETLELAMHGVKQSLNVSVAGAIAMYQLLY